ncbi:helix-turn-helix transcriptional regulator [Heliorestis acidaminivorans]|uniref:helix-turn-helix transcriptional regulator n=1 Tax=Heliorestis acidaminivorans TaxID=553427 RepID=UPI001478F339|nr:helix-turn-helix transcriptional regulator [Heliorestis acidaminivorans]
MELTDRQIKIVEIVKERGPITGEQIGEILNLTRATLRPDLAILTMSGILEARPRVGYYYNGQSGNTLVARAIGKIRVKDVKSLPVVVREATTVYDAIVTLFTEDVGTLIIVDNEGGLIGVVSRKDLLKIAIGGNDAQKIPISMVMTRMPNIVTVTPEDTIYQAAKRLIVHEIDTLPVVRTFALPNGHERQEVVGRITKTTITKLLVELGEGHN